MPVTLTNQYYDALPATVSRVAVTPFKHPTLVAYSADVAGLLGIPLRFFQSASAPGYLSGATLFSGSIPLAQKYAGHQFGIYNPELGDGRGLLLGDILAKDGHCYELHLKGAGKTPYSRFGDGRAVLRSSIREFLCSEAMHYLGIPSSRALSLVGSDEPVQRETTETAAMMIRVCQSHIRFGHFENYFYLEQQETLKQLIDFTIAHYYPDCNTSANPVQALLEQVVLRTADLIAHWQAVGFAHGVMNTDNMSILGITFDYGPFAFMDTYEPGFICNHSDHQGRYAFDEQPSVALWNLNALGHALSPFIPAPIIAETLALYEQRLIKRYMQLMREKLGLFTAEEDDRQLIGHWLALLQQQQLDYTQSFRLLCRFNPLQHHSALRDSMINTESFDQWATRYRQRLSRETLSQTERQHKMEQRNPLYILRNYLAQQAIAAAEDGNYEPLHELQQVLSNPYTEQAGKAAFAALPPEWGKKLQISCSS
ncbi:YdiU family protein [Chromatiaceae bacterium AAb-1]|nr:YdiU family protein [Chromatiaceae bacterium AAb-1]